MTRANWTSATAWPDRPPPFHPWKLFFKAYPTKSLSLPLYPTIFSLYPSGLSHSLSAFVGYQDECAAAALELTHNWDRDGYTQGDGYGHLAIEVEDAAVTCARARALGYRVTREAGPMQHGRSVIAFLEDPDGYKVELIQKGTQFD